MTNQKEAFEKFMGTNKAILMVSMCRTGDRFERDVAELAWQAAQADQAATIAELQADNAKLREFIDKAFESHTNLDLDIEALGETK